MPAFSLKVQAQSCLEALTVLYDLEQRQATPTPLERQQLQAFPGFGCLALDLFPHATTGAYKDATWETLGTQLQTLLTPADYASASRAVYTQFFTPRLIMRALFLGLRHCGLPDDAVVLEPGCGIGRFMGVAPSTMAFLGIEQESLSGRICRALYPQHDIRIAPIERTTLEPGSVDAVLGNVPFARERHPYWGRRLALHELCLAKGMDALRPGGLMAVVVTHSLLDRTQAHVRDALADRAELLGAIRLPSDAFAAEGTRVVADLVWLRKRLDGDIPGDRTWTQTAPLAIDGTEVAISQYFHDHPDHVLGAWSREDRLYAHASYSLTPTGALAEQLATVLSQLPEGVYTPGPRTVLARRPTPTTPPPLPEGSFLVHGQGIFQVENGQIVQACHGTRPIRLTSTLGARLAHLVRLRDQARAVLQAQLDGAAFAVRHQARQALQQTYLAFLRQYGAINKVTLSARQDGSVQRLHPNLVGFGEDPDCAFVMALEVYDEDTGTGRPAPLLTQDVVGTLEPITHVESAAEGLLVVLNTTGQVRLTAIADLYGQPEDVVLAELGDLLYHDPASQTWVTRDVYCSGNVRVKLAQAEAAETSDPAYGRNVQALREAQPPDLLPSEIDVQLGHPLLRPGDIRDFAAETFKIEPWQVDVAHVADRGLWSVTPTRGGATAPDARASYGSSRITGFTLLEQALNHQFPTITDPVPQPDGRTKYVVNAGETLVAREKQQALGQACRDWLFAEPERAARMVRRYNDTYNVYRRREWNGDHLDFPGMSPEWAAKLRPHQKAVIWRIMTAGNTVVGHEVGAGKTASYFAAGMKMKQTGLIRKPVYTVPNALLAQFARECQMLYPAARLLIATPEDVTKAKRQRLAAKMLSQDWDGIILTHRGFEQLGLSAPFQQACLEELLAAFEAVVIDGTGNEDDGPGQNLRKRLEQEKNACRRMLETLMQGKTRDDGLLFDELGIDWLCVDECFPYETVIATDHGPMLIGDIVTQRRQVRVQSYDLAQRRVVWKPVVHWFTNVRRHPFVEVEYEGGRIICTTQHHIWVEGRGYTNAGDLCPGDRVLVWDSAATGAAEILQRLTQDDRPACQSSESGEVVGVYGTPLRQEATAGAHASRCGDPHACQQSHGQPGSQGQSHRGPAGTPTPTTDPRRKWTEHASAPTAAGSGYGYAPRVRHTHEADLGTTPPTAAPLQSRFGRPADHDGGGSRWGQSWQSQSTGTGSEEGYGPRVARVVRVAVLEPAGAGRDRDGGRDHQAVYDLEVADTHNYLANGLLVSNCHYFKNMQTATKMQRVAGVQTDGSQRTMDLFMKARYLDTLRPGWGLVGGTGTLVSNSMVELYTFMQLFIPDQLRAQGLSHFDSWAGAFGEVVERMEIGPDGQTLRPRHRFAHFINVPELLELLWSFADIKTEVQLQLPKPALGGDQVQVVARPMSPEQAVAQAQLVRRYEQVRAGQLPPWEALRITTQGRHLALDGRLVMPNAPDFPQSKVHACVATVLRHYRASMAYRGTQLIFADLGVNPTTWGFSAYEALVDALVAAGIPRHAIGRMDQANTSLRRQELFEQVRQGTIRVLIGSTERMGTGANVQTRLVALHHLDCPWTPAQLRQRVGRILRPGNLHRDWGLPVWVYAYVTEQSFDAVMYQANETKAHMIGQVLSGQTSMRRVEDIGEEELTYAQIKALAAGNQAMFTLAETDMELRRLTLLKKHHQDARFQAQRVVKNAPTDQARQATYLASLEADQQALEGWSAPQSLELPAGAFAAGPWCPLNTATAIAHLHGVVGGLTTSKRLKQTLALGTYRGLRFGITTSTWMLPDIWLQGQTTRRTVLYSTPLPGRAVLACLEDLRQELPGQIAKAQRHLREMQDQQRLAEVQLTTPWTLDGYAQQLTALRDQLKTALTPQGDARQQAPLVDAIEALRAAHQHQQPATARTEPRRVPLVPSIIPTLLQADAPDEDAGSLAAAD